jgi:hypothetical protein
MLAMWIPFLSAALRPGMTSKVAPLSSPAVRRTGKGIQSHAEHDESPSVDASFRECRCSVIGTALLSRTSSRYTLSNATGERA